MPHTAPEVPITTLICAFAVLTYCALGDLPAIVCGALAAVCGPATEIALAAAGQFHDSDDSDALFKGAPWLVPRYFAFGIVAALIGEIAAATKRLSP